MAKELPGGSGDNKHPLGARTPIRPDIFVFRASEEPKLLSIVYIMPKRSSKCGKLKFSGLGGHFGPKRCGAKSTGW